MSAEPMPSIDSELLQEYRAYLRDGARRSFLIGVGLLGFSAFLVFGSQAPLLALFTGLLPSLAVISLLSGLHDLRKARLATEAEAQVFEELALFDEKIRGARLLHTYILIGGLGLLFLAQHSVGLNDSIAIAGLVKDRVREGEWWRLLSCALLHANTLHILTNAATLLMLGRIIETQGDPDDLPIVFTVAVFTGSVASCLLMPSVPSVGASGGILGLSGYLLVLAVRRRAQLPAGLGRHLWRGVALTALVGVLGYHYIDNAANIGGLLGGALCGLLLIRPKPDSHPHSTGAILKAMSAWGCLGWFGGAAFFCLRRLLNF